MFGGRGTIDVSVPAYVGLVIATVGLISTPIVTASRREARILRRFHATPLHPAVYLAAQMIMFYVVTLLGVACLVVVGRLAYDMRFDGQPLEVWAAFSLSTLAFLALGWVVGSLAPTAQTAQAGGMILAFVMMALGGAWAPLEVLGESVLRISRFLPLTHVVLLMRGVWAGNSLADHTGDLLFLGAILVIGGFLAVRLFRWE